MTLVLRCQKCRNSSLEIRSGTQGHHADLWCGQCDRFIRHLSKYQARAFERHLPKPEPQQLSLLPQGGEP